MKRRRLTSFLFDYIITCENNIFICTTSHAIGISDESPEAAIQDAKVKLLHIIDCFKLQAYSTTSSKCIIQITESDLAHYRTESLQDAKQMHPY